MSADRFSSGYTEVTETSWLGRIKRSLSGMVMGLIFLVAAFPLLFWNEGRAIKRYKSLKEGGGRVVSVPADRVNPENEAKLIHLTGLATTSETLTDPRFRVSARALALVRTVEMFQWRENQRSKTEKKLGGGERTVTEYFYEKVWSETPIDSSGFKAPNAPRNPPEMPARSESFSAGKVTLGAFTLPPSLADDIRAYQPLAVTESAGSPHISGRDCIPFEGGYYCGRNPNAPQIGDIKISFKCVPPTTVSLAARQQGNTLDAYLTETGGAILLLQTGTHTAQSMFKTAQTQNKYLTWALRLAGFILMWIGLSAILKPLSVMADVAPFVGNLVGAGTRFVAFLISGSLSCVTIAIAWVVYRPMIGAILIGGAILLFGWIVSLSRKQAGQRPPVAPSGAASRPSQPPPPAGPPVPPPPPPGSIG